MKKIYTLFTSLLIVVCCQTNVFADDRQILNELFTATGGVANGGLGNTWLRYQNWGTLAPLNTWYGVQTDASGLRVISLDLDNNPNTYPSFWGSDGATNGLSGTLPVSLGGLTELRYLAITNNPNLHGSVPTGLNQLEQMFLQGNHLDYSIPDLSAYSNLLFLYLNNNNLTGGFPGTLGALSNLIVMHLGDNPSLGGSIPSTWYLPSMSELWLQNTGLGGIIPLNIGTEFPNLTFLQLHTNNLIDGIPTSLGQLHQMQYLALSHNPLGGLIPDFVMPNAQEIMLNNAGLIGAIPPTFNSSTNLGNLPKLHLENNLLSGDIPSFNNLLSLNEINVSNNKFIFGDMQNDAWLNIANKIYAPQKTILLAPIQSGNILTANNAGVTNPSLLTYTWYNGTTLVYTGGSTYQPTMSGNYSYRVTCAGVTLSGSPNTNLILESATLTVAAILPLELLSFDAEKKEDAVLLNWKTSNEQNTSHFNIQRSTDGTRFSNIGKVTSNNKTTLNDYRFEDKNLPFGTLYYRLEQVDRDEKTTFSPIRSVEKSDKFYYNLSPNPTQDILSINGNADYDLDMTIDIFNEASANVYQKMASVNRGTFEQKIDMTAFPEGAYIVLMRLPNGFSMKKTVMKIK